MRNPYRRSAPSKKRSVPVVEDDEAMMMGSFRKNAYVGALRHSPAAQDGSGSGSPGSTGRRFHGEITTTSTPAKAHTLMPYRRNPLIGSIRHAPGTSTHEPLRGILDLLDSHQSGSGHKSPRASGGGVPVLTRLASRSIRLKRSGYSTASSSTCSSSSGGSGPKYAAPVARQVTADDEYRGIEQWAVELGKVLHARENHITVGGDA